VHDSRTVGAARLRQAAQVVNQSVDQCSRMVSDGRMGDHPGRFVDYHQMLILMHDIERNRFAFQVRFDHRRDGQNDCLPPFDPMFLEDRLTVERDQTAFEQLLDAAASEIQIIAGGKIAIQSFGRQVIRDSDHYFRSILMAGLGHNGSYWVGTGLSINLSISITARSYPTSRARAATA